MSTTRTRTIGVAAAILIGVAAAAAPRLVSRTTLRAPEPVKMAPGVGMPGGPPTSSVGLQQRITEMEGRLQKQPGDLRASVLLSDALLRQARSTNDGRPANRAA